MTSNNIQVFNHRSNKLQLITIYTQKQCNKSFTYMILFISLIEITRIIHKYFLEFQNFENTHEFSY